MAKKQILQLNAKCITKNEREGGGNVLLAIDVTQTEKGPAARKVINIQTNDAKELAAFAGRKNLFNHF